jgi:hypothetical protein
MRFGADLFTLAIFLFVLQEWLRRKGKGIAWGLYLALPVLLTPTWVQGESTALCRQFDNPVYFCWLKLYSVSIAASWFTWLRFTPYKDRKWMQYVSMLILPVNMLEAIVQDLFAGQLHQYLNAAAGILLVVSLPFSRQAFQLTIRGDCHDLDWEGTSRLWIAGYSIWNWVFIYYTFPVIAGQHLAVLGAAFAVGMIEPRRWLQARTYSLAVALFLLFTFPSFLVSRMGTVEWSNVGGTFLGVSISLGFAVFITVRLAYSRIQKFAQQQSRWNSIRNRIASEN